MDIDFGFSVIEQAFRDRQAERNRIATEFDQKNPWAYDEVLAQKTKEAKEQFDPYYNQVLDDFLSGIRTQTGRTIEDSRQLLSELSQDTITAVGRAKENLTVALDRAKQGASQAGLYFSGQAQREQGLQEKQTGESISDILTSKQRQQGKIGLQTGRTLEDIQRQESLGTRDIETERDYQTRLQALNLTREAGIKRQYALRQALAPYSDEGFNLDVLQGLEGLG